jgi:hypothetical protein
MAQTVVMTDVPPSDVDRVIAEYEAEGATATKTLQSNGNYTITASFPDGKAVLKISALSKATMQHAVFAWKVKGK